MSLGKHAPWRYRSYVLHVARTIEARTFGSFVRSNDLGFVEVEGPALLLSGVIECVDGIRIEVMQRLRLVSEGDNPRLMLTKFRYHAQIVGAGPILRYDSPHRDHRPYDHVHHYDPIGGRKPVVHPLFGVSDIPLLEDVLDEVESWYREHGAALRFQRLPLAG